ncbi:hypothetical protein DSECCO2_655210 [anaerobic digester metagenome]
MNVANLAVGRFVNQLHIMLHPVVIIQRSFRSQRNNNHFPRSVGRGFAVDEHLNLDIGFTRKQ